MITTATTNTENINLSENICFYSILNADATKWKDDFLLNISMPDTVDKISIEAYMQKTFNELASQWRRETSGSSSPLEIIGNENYLTIIKKGGENRELILRFILADLQKGRSYWFEALKIISGENPIGPEVFSSYKLVVETWLNWGRQKGYL